MVTLVLTKMCEKVPRKLKRQRNRFNYYCFDKKVRKVKKVAEYISYYCFDRNVQKRNEKVEKVAEYIIYLSFEEKTCVKCTYKMKKVAE